MITTTYFEGIQKARGNDAAERSMQYVKRHWKYYEPDHRVDRDNGLTDLVERLQTHSLCISGMAFQDAWNIDLERLQRCCIHVITESKKLVPFCAYYLTDSRGRRLVETGSPIY